MRELGGQAHPAREKVGELGRRHFTGPNRKFAVLDLAAAARCGNLHIVRGIGDQHEGPIGPHQPRPIALIAGIDTQHAMSAKLPQFAHDADGLLADCAGRVS